MKVKKTDLPVMPPEDILPSLDDEADESDMDDGKILWKFLYILRIRLIFLFDPLSKMHNSYCILFNGLCVCTMKP